MSAASPASAPVPHSGAAQPAQTVDLSIVIVSYNTREILRDCLRSVERGLGDLAAEIFVVDNASTDGSAEMVQREHPQVVLLRNETNRGFAAANNQALERARGRYALLLNSDTVVLGDALSACVRYMDDHPEVGVMACKALNPDGSTQMTCFMEPTLFNLLLKTTGLFRLPWPRFLGREHFAHWRRDSERDVPVVTGCFMLVRREAMEQVGLMDDRFLHCGEETDWCRRFRKAGWRIRFAPVGEYIHIGNASGRANAPRRDLLLTAGLIRFHRKHHGALAAAAAFALLWCFNASRAALWTLWALLGRRPAAKERAAHFRAVVKGFASTWPGRERANHAGA